MKNRKLNPIIVWIIGIVAVIAFLYLMGFITQLIVNYQVWEDRGGISGDHYVDPVDWNIFACIEAVFSLSGLRIVLGAIVVGAICFGVYKLYDRFDGKDRDDRGFTKSKYGTYGTADLMREREIEDILSFEKKNDPQGIIIGEYKKKLVCLPNDTFLNKNIAIFGSPGSMKSRAIIRNRLFQALKHEESVIVTDPKGELYGDTAELYRKNGYVVRVLNLVNPERSDSWNCMDDLNGNDLLAQLLTDVIIGNTSDANPDRFWDNGEMNLLKTLILYTDLINPDPSKKSLPFVYDLLTTQEEDLKKKIESHPHPGLRKSYGFFRKASPTVREGIFTGLGSRLQIFQNQTIRNITRKSDIDLTLPGKVKCAYFVIISDTNSALSFLSSLFFSLMFEKLFKYADAQPDRKCAVPVNFVMDEFNNLGKIGGKADGSSFAQILSVCRSRNVRVMIANQSLGQLQNRYPNNLWAEIMSNCDIHLMLGCADEITAKYFSNRSGEMTIEVNSTMTVRKTIAIGQVIPTYRSQEGLGRRKVLTPDEVLRLPLDEMLCVIRGYNALKLKKWDYVNHPLAKEIVKVALDDYIPCSLPIEEPYHFNDDGELVVDSKNESNNDEDSIVSIDAHSFFKR